MHKKTPISCQNIASLLMDYFKALPEPLLTFDLEPKFIEVAKDINLEDEKKIKEIQNLIQQLPLVNRQTAKIYFDHLKRVTEHSDVNQMTETNIVICVVGGRPVTPIYVLFLKYFEEIFLGVSGKVDDENFKKEDLSYTITTSDGFSSNILTNESDEQENFQHKIEQHEILLDKNIREIKEEIIIEDSEENLENIKIMLNQNLFHDISNRTTPGNKKQVQTSFVKPKDQTSKEIFDQSQFNRWDSKDSTDFNNQFNQESIGTPEMNFNGNQFQEFKFSERTSPIPVGSKKHSKRSKTSSSQHHSRTTSTDIPTDIDGYVDSPCDSETTISPRNGSLSHSQRINKAKNKILETHETQLDTVEKIQGNDAEYEDLIQDIIKRANQKFGTTLKE